MYALTAWCGLDIHVRAGYGCCLTANNLSMNMRGFSCVGHDPGQEGLLKAQGWCHKARIHKDPAIVFHGDSSSLDQVMLEASVFVWQIGWQDGFAICWALKVTSCAFRLVCHALVQMRVSIPEEDLLRDRESVQYTAIQLCSCKGNSPEDSGVIIRVTRHRRVE